MRHFHLSNMHLGVLVLALRFVGLMCLEANQGKCMAFSPNFAPIHREMSTIRLRNLHISMQSGGGFGQPKEGNREQRRATKKADKAKPAVSEGNREQGASRTVTDSSATPTKVEKPAALEKLKKESARNREDFIRGTSKQSQSPMAPRGLPLEQEVRQIPVETLKQIENGLLVGVLAAGGLWVLAGLGTAFDAYMIATKQTVPAGLDEALSKYVEPFLTPGLAAILIFSIMLGGIQVYKFEGGRKQ